MSVRLLLDRLQGGGVQRYHTAPSVGAGQNVGAHTWRAMVILHTLWPDVSWKAMIHMMYHDIAEAQLGDLPATVKWKYPELEAAYSVAEAEVEEGLEVGHMMFPRDIARCKMADLLELVLHAKQQFDNGNREAWEVYKRGVDYLLEHFKGTEDFGPVLEVLISLRCPTPLEMTKWL